MSRNAMTDANRRTTSASSSARTRDAQPHGQSARSDSGVHPIVARLFPRDSTSSFETNSAENRRTTKHEQSPPKTSRLKIHFASAWKPFLAFRGHFEGLFSRVSAKASLGGLLLLAAIAWLSIESHHYIRHSPRFALRRLILDGAERLTRAEVEALAGIREGDNIFRVAPQRIEARLMESPWIKSVSVVRTLPGQLAVHVDEHRAHMLLALDNAIPTGSSRNGMTSASTFLIDSDGAVFKPYEVGDPVELPIFSGLDSRRLQTDIVYRQEMMREALWLLEHFPRQLGAIHEIHVDAGERFSLRFGNDTQAQTTRVELGKVENQEETATRLTRLARLVRTLKARNRQAEYVLLFGDSASQRAVVRLFD